MFEGDTLESIKLTNRFKFTEVLIIVVITSIFSVFAGITYGRLKYSTVVYKNSESEKYEMSDDLKYFVENYLYIINNYYDKSSIDEGELLDGAIKVIISKLGLNDDYSVYMGEGEYNNFNINLEGNYEGFGIISAKEKEDDYITIVSILENSPAEKSGIKAGDVILAIDGKDVRKFTTQEFSQYIKNSAEKNFALKIKRGKETKNINIKKDSIDIKSVTSKVIEKNNKKIGYIYISIFANNTYTQFKEELEKLEKEKIDGLIIDLRDNSGGHLTTVAKIISLFLNKDKTIYKLKTDKKTTKTKSTGKKDYELPIVFISNGQTASASEVMIYALKDNLNAKLVGEKTFGKGTVQEMIGLNNGNQYKITTKKWLSPNGKWVNDTKGIEPDFESKLSDKYLKDPKDENDNQLQDALSVIVKERKSK